MQKNLEIPFIDRLLNLSRKLNRISRRKLVIWFNHRFPQADISLHGIDNPKVVALFVESIPCHVTLRRG